MLKSIERLEQGYGFTYLGEARVSKCSLLLLLLGRPFSNFFYFLFFLSFSLKVFSFLSLAHGFLSQKEKQKWELKSKKNPLILERV